MSEKKVLCVTRIVSGGQTGVDRGALDAAIALAVEHGGWCPRGRLAEDGVIPAKYQLRETSSAEYPVRTEKNVVDSDGTLILFRGRLHGGTELTYRLAGRHLRPRLMIELIPECATDHVCDWLREKNIATLNVAGPRESSAPGIAAETRRFLMRALEGG